MNTPAWRLGAGELAALYRSGETSPSEVAEGLLSYIGTENPSLNAMVALDEDAVRCEAAASTQRFVRKDPLGPLDGVPLVVKDSINVAGLPTSWGTGLYRDCIPPHDEQPVARLRAAGMVVMGKTNVPEFALRGFTNNPEFGPTRNPWNRDMTTGGSSGGTVSAVSAGFAPLGLAADAGGSLRRPAGFAGLVGLKPSIGRVPRRNALPATTADYDVVGPVARTASDLILAFSVIARPDPGVLASAMFLQPAMPGQLPPQRILLVEHIRNSPVDHEVLAQVRQAASRLEALGHQVETGEAPFDTTAFNRGFGPVSRAGLAWANKDQNWHKGVSEEFQNSIAAGMDLPAIDYLDALEIARQFREQIADAYETIDMIMTPSSATLPWLAEERAPQTINGEPADTGAHSVFTGFANIAGYPGVAIPAGLSRSGLPIGFQLVGRFGADELLLAMAAQYERAHPWPLHPFPAAGQ